MKKSNYTTVTKENLHLILHRIKQFINRTGCITMQGFYHNSKRFNSQFPFLDKKVEKSMLSYLLKDDCIVEIEKNMGEPFIRVNYQYGTHGFTIKIGDKIRFTGSHVYFLTNFPTDKTKYLDVWVTSSEHEKAWQEAVISKQYDDGYWEMEYEDF